MNRTLITASLVAAAAALTACASKVDLAESAPATAAAPAQETAQASPPTSQSDVAAVDLTQGSVSTEAGDAASRFVYFEFDSFAIAPQFKPVVERHAQGLVQDRDKRLVIAGHADERGSREYNLALGQKRADAVARSLALLGADASRVETVSFGEERPKAQGANEDAWALNRRAELTRR
jgi:peptidoglycan-associated lipoprotein